jgi:hypothetical protein
MVDAYNQTLNFGTSEKDVRMPSWVNNSTPLHEATFKLDDKTVLWLLKHGAFPDQRDMETFTPLHNLAMMGEDYIRVVAMTNEFAKREAWVERRIARRCLTVRVGRMSPWSLSRALIQAEGGELTRGLQEDEKPRSD